MGGYTELIYKNLSLDSSKLELKASLHLPPRIKGLVFYFHGGGFIYGRKDDLPPYYLKSLMDEGYALINLDYPLLPQSSFENILASALEAVDFVLDKSESLGIPDSPFFLWGRSAGAFLAMLSASRLKSKPRAVISYYGYGFLTPSWYDSPSSYYLGYPRISKKKLESLLERGDERERFLIYLYARQTGSWLSLISNNRERDFLERYSLANVQDPENFPSLFLAHSFKDPDVPFLESLELSRLFRRSTLFSSSSPSHDFDSKAGRERERLLDSTLKFLNSNI